MGNRGVAETLLWGGEDFSADDLRSAGFRALLRYSERLICMRGEGGVVEGGVVEGGEENKMRYKRLFSTSH